MSRFAEGVGALRRNGRVVLFDEQKEQRAVLVEALPTAEAVAGPVDWATTPACLVLGAGAVLPPAFAGLGLPRRETVPGGVLVRPALAEAASDLLGAAGRTGPGLMTTLADGADAGQAFAQRHDLPLVSLQDIVVERLAHETIVEDAATARLPSLYAQAEFEVHAYRGLLDGCEHLAMLRRPSGTAAASALPLVRVHSECLTGDALGSLRCDCGEQLRESLRAIAADPAGGILVYLRGHEGRGIGLVNKIRAYALQDLGRDTVEANHDLGFPADLRDYGVAVQILQSLKAHRVRLLSNNPRKSLALERYGIAVAERIPLRIRPNRHNAVYLETKRRKLGHDLAAG